MLMVTRKLVPETQKWVYNTLENTDLDKIIDLNRCLIIKGKRKRCSQKRQGSLKQTEKSYELN